jgi:two-component system sensor histidine kinase KdpD
LSGYQSRLLEALRLVLELRSACIFDASTAELHGAGKSQHGLEEKTRAAYVLGRDADEPGAGVAIRCLRAAGKIMGAIGFDGLDDEESMAGPVAALAATIIERARTIRTASHAAAAARTETLRAAILDALAHEFRSPLAAILTAAGGLREAGPLGREQMELAEIVESEAERLSALSSRLLRLARLDREEVKTRMEPIDIRAVVAASVERHAKHSLDRVFSFVQQHAPEEVLADAELFQLALSQLLDNACRYSPAGSTVKVSLESDQHFLTVVVWNSGDAIPPAEAEHIFERFYRGPQGRRLASGSGLGLYVARKIALAHGGSLNLDSRTMKEGVSFRLAIPISGGQANLAERTI